MPHCATLWHTVAHLRGIGKLGQLDSYVNFFVTQLNSSLSTFTETQQRTHRHLLAIDNINHYNGLES